MNSALNISTPLPLSGVRVVSIALNLPGPACVRRLADFGASVIKVEPPDALGGDPMQSYAASYYEALHAGVDVRTLNLKDAVQRAAFDELLANADVFITAQREAALARLQLTGEALSSRFSSLCHVAIVGDENSSGAGPDLTYLEIGPGDCSLANEVARLVRKVYAVDVSHEITKEVELPDNVELIISDGSSIPVPNDSIDLAYSDQLMEHLHPDDAVDQLANIYRSLVPGGRYVCITPNRLSGPHDVSQYFDDVASGFHLKEYTLRELSGIFSRVGFRRFQALVGARGFELRVPALFPRTIEFLLEKAGGGFGRKAARGLPLRLILGVKLIAWK